MNLLLPDHTSQTNSKLTGGHRASQSDQHLPAFIKVPLVRPSSIKQLASIEVKVLPLYEVADLAQPSLLHHTAVRKF